MSNARYKLYVDDVLLLARSIVLKSESTANSINQFFRDSGAAEVFEEQPETWKYYLNLAGEYHSTDTRMFVTSLDTREMIEFSKANLVEHRATKRGYLPGTRFYKELVRKYPNQIDLIQGILEPIDIQQAIAARDGEILSYDTNLVESNETNLIPELQKKIDGWKVRWDVVDYAKVDDLYPAANLAILYMNIPLFILNIRLANCRTEKVHSFHIRQYLASNGKLDSYIDNLNKKQMLFLYRNIQYINRNAGKQETFDWLVENLLTERLLPLAKYRLQHNISGMPNKLLPTINAKRFDLTKYVSGTARDIYSANELIQKEVSVTRNNVHYQAEALQDLTHKYGRHTHSELPTKVLESSVVDRSEAFSVKLGDVLLNHWISWACEGNYLAMTNFDNPANGESLWFTAKDAFILFLYAYNASHGVRLEQVPDVVATFVRKPVIPSVAEMRALAQPSRVPTEWIHYLREDQPVIGDVISTAAFYEKCQEIHKAWKLHSDFIAFREHMVTRGQVENVAYHLYQDVHYDLAGGMDYADWLKAKNLELDNLSHEEFDLLANNLMATATGSDLKVSVGLSDLQESMVRLLRQLSSYSIQVVTELQGKNITVVGCPAIRVGDYQGRGEGVTRIHQSNVYVQDLFGKGYNDEYVDLSDATFESNTSATQFHTDKLDPTLDMSSGTGYTSRVRMTIPSVYATLTVRPLEGLEDVFPVRTSDEYRYPDTPPEDLDI